MSADAIAAGDLRSKFDAIVITDEPRGVLVGGGRGGERGGAPGEQVAVPGALLAPVPLAQRLHCPRVTRTA